MNDSPRHHDNFSLKEGAVVLEYPSNMSAESYDYFKRWALLILEKTKPKKPELIEGQGGGVHSDWQLADLIIRNVCGLDPDDPEKEDTISINIDTLRVILRAHLAEKKE